MPPGTGWRSWPTWTPTFIGAAPEPAARRGGRRSSEAPVELDHPCRRRVPVVPGRPGPAPLDPRRPGGGPGVGERRDRPGERVDVGRWHQERGIAEHLGERAGVSGDHRDAALHRLEGWETEPF